MNAERFALYFVPEPNAAFYRFGAGVIGYDCFSGEQRPAPPGLGGADWRALTEEPRRYGFHATLKAPFRLRQGASIDALVEAAEAFARRWPVAPRFTPVVRLLAGFAAIMPAEAADEIGRLADDCVEAFEPFRAPLTVEERQRRVAAGLTADLIERLDTWGYPFVFEAFRFHMTLTGRLPLDRQAEVVAHLAAQLAEAWGSRPVAVDRLAVMHQATPAAPFRVLHLVSIGTPQTRDMHAAMTMPRWQGTPGR